MTLLLVRFPKELISSMKDRETTPGFLRGLLKGGWLDVITR